MALHEERGRLRALTVQQPWAWAIIHGGKDVENRGRNRHLRGRFYVHAGLKHSTQNDAFVRHHARVRALPERRYGHIIGTEELYDVLPPMDPPAFDGPWAFANQWLWLLRDPRPLSRPIAATGRLGWWEYSRSRR
jgi:hypothetical protein